jgi:hypothetical protein
VVLALLAKMAAEVELEMAVLVLHLVLPEQV